MATATVETPTIALSYATLLDLFGARMRQAELLESKGATIKNRIYEARAVEIATLMKYVAVTPDEVEQAENLRQQAEARAFNHKAVKEERAIRRAEFKAANPTVTEQE